MDPFYQIFCRACHNYFMYCDCVHSYEDVIPEDDISHESEAGNDDDDDDLDSGPDFDAPDFVNWDPDVGYPDPQYFEPSDPKKPKPDPSSKPPPSEPKPGPPILVDKPKPDPGYGYDGPTPQNNIPPVVVPDDKPAGYKPWGDIINDSLKPPGKRKDPPLPPPKPGSNEIALAYYKGGQPYPYWTSPSVNSIMDTLNCPVYCGPQDADDPEWQDFVNNELEPWYEDLPDADKRTYMGACFVADPKHGVQQGPLTNFWVGITYDKGRVSGELHNQGTYPYIYSIVPIVDGVRVPGDTRHVYSDRRMPARAFSGEEAFSKYFTPISPGADEYVCTYKQPRTQPPDPQNRSGVAYRFYQSGIADPPPYLPSIDVSIPDPPLPGPDFLTDPDWFVNSRGNTKSINGLGYKNYTNSPGGSGFFEPFFDAGYVSQTLWKTNGNDPQYPSNPVGNVPNPRGFTGIINPTQIFQSSSVAVVYNPQDYSSTRTFMYGNLSTPMDVFNFPCECVNRGTNGVSAFYHVSVECKVITWNWTTPKWNAYSLKRVGNTATKVYHELYDGVIMASRPDGLQRVAIEQMTKLKDRDDPAPVSLPGTINIGETWILSILVEVPDDDGYLDSTKNADPFIFVQLNDSQLEIVKVKTMLKDNTRTARVDGKASLAALVAAGNPLSLFGDFDPINTSYLWNNRALNVVSWFSSTQIAKKIGLFKRFGATNQLQISMHTIWNNDSIYKSRNVGWPILPYYIPSNLNYVGVGLDIAVDTFRLGPFDKSTEAFPGFLQQHINVLLIGSTWLPMDY